MLIFHSVGWGEVMVEQLRASYSIRTSKIILRQTLIFQEDDIFCLTQFFLFSWPSSRFGGRSWILGYELLNEPWTGDVFMDASLILPGNAGGQLLEPFFNRASDAIRAVDNETIVFWEPVTYAYLVQVHATPKIP
jgi:hypothetical protein